MSMDSPAEYSPEEQKSGAYLQGPQEVPQDPSEHEDLRPFSGFAEKAIYRWLGPSQQLILPESKEEQPELLYIKPPSQIPEQLYNPLPGPLARFARDCALWLRKCLR